MNTPPLHTPSAPAWDGLPMPRRLWAIVAVAFGVSLSVIDGAIANVALPTIGRELGISEADSIWIVNAYQLAIMVSLLSFSALGDVVGYRKVYLGGLALFTLASVGCACSYSFATLVLTRVLQGFGAAAITSVNTTLIRNIYPRAQLGRGMGINATVVAVSAVAGPTLAAAILSVASWPWLFAVNIPVGLVALTLSHRFLPRNPVRVTSRHFSWRDAVMNALTFGLMMASVEGFSHGLDPRILSVGVAALLVIGFFFIRSQLREEYPILPFDLLRIPIFSVSVATSICSFLGQMLALVALPFYLQHACGYDDVSTGLLLTAWPAVIMIVAPVAGILVEHIHAGLLGGVGLLAMTAGLFLLAFLPEHPTDFEIIWRLVLCGAVPVYVNPDVDSRLGISLGMQREQVRFSRPVSVQVGGYTSVHAPYSWPMALRGALFSSPRVVSMAAAEQPKPIRIENAALPVSPALRKMPSVIKASADI